jgi:hypothetical protein
VKIVIGIEVKSTDFREVKGIARKTGKNYAFREQSGWADLGKPYPVEIRWVLSDDSAPSPIGRYVLDESAVYVDRNGSIQVNVKSMKPVAAAAAVSRTA